jgi:hypothetical protein
VTREHPEDWRNNAADRAAATATNIANAARNQEPVGTLSTATSVVKHVVFSTGQDCSCSCAAVCSCEPPQDVA